MKSTYLTHSRTAHVSLAVMAAASLLGTVVLATALPIWLIPVGYFAALIAAVVLFVGWVRWSDPDI
ncbi:hypothetical protein [Jannaschia formosa]|uniref:hypothetical protein n=1 Tax=Jannaschia formosa TaxID=2259592 RepID=UPI000E1BB441|nr:hypothetical protein [Jannaschia formosa]TFL17425.1 hypothetical protein DR046_14550 [Jannaschia formosa]